MNNLFQTFNIYTPFMQLEAFLFLSHPELQPRFPSYIYTKRSEHSMSARDARHCVEQIVLH